MVLLLPWWIPLACCRWKFPWVGRNNSQDSTHGRRTALVPVEERKVQEFVKYVSCSCITRPPTRKLHICMFSLVLDYLRPHNINWTSWTLPLVRLKCWKIKNDCIQHYVIFCAHLFPGTTYVTDTETKRRDWHTFKNLVATCINLISFEMTFHILSIMTLLLNYCITIKI